MQNNETLEDRISRHEGGFRLVAYDDATGKNVVPPGGEYEGKLTIGAGRCLDTHPFTPEEVRYVGHDGRSYPITKEQAIWLLHRDINDCTATMEHSFPWTDGLTQIRQEVIIEMLFQLGLGTFMKFKQTIAYMKSGDAPAAAAEMLDSDWHKQTPARAEELSKLYNNG